MARKFASLGALAAHFEAMAAATPGLERVALGRIGAAVEKRAQQKFGQYQAGWPPLAESTLADKERRGYPSPSPLLREGEAQASVAHTVDALSVHIGSNDQVMVYHTYGTSKMPARPVLAPAMIESLAENMTIIDAMLAQVFR